MAKKQKSQDDAVNQRDQDYKVGPGNPPKEYQWPPGVSGNPKGQPKHRTHLWTHYCRYMAMTDAERRKLDKSKLTASQKTALKMVEKAVKGLGCGAERMARYVVDREEGKAAEHLIIGSENILTDEECEQLRQLILKNYGDSN
jgi:hypothetical protein